MSTNVKTKNRYLGKTVTSTYYFSTNLFGQYNFSWGLGMFISINEADTICKYFSNDALQYKCQLVFNAHFLKSMHRIVTFYVDGRGYNPALGITFPSEFSSNPNKTLEIGNKAFQDHS